MPCLLLPATSAKPEVLVLSWARPMLVKMIDLTRPTSTLHLYKRHDGLSSQYHYKEKTRQFICQRAANTMLANKLS